MAAVSKGKCFMYTKKRFAAAIAAVLAIVMLLTAVCACDGGSVQEPMQPTQNEGPATVRVTFPEGQNIMQMSQRLEKNGVCSAADLVAQMNSTDYSADYSFLPSFAELEGREYKLEGYMFPDTYDFYVGESADSVIRRFLNNFRNRIPQELMDACASTGDFYGQSMSFDDIIIMASIVEREINVPSEMPGVAAVFYNRMKYPGGTVSGSATGGYFQSDATKFYPYVYDTVPEGFVSEYNTFNVKGLPKGPICCPSYNAIYGSIYPDNSNEAFFFYTDINKKVYYAVTLKEHQANWKYCRDNGLEPVW